MKLKIIDLEKWKGKWKLWSEWTPFNFVFLLSCDQTCVVFELSSWRGWIDLFGRDTDDEFEWHRNDVHRGRSIGGESKSASASEIPHTITKGGRHRSRLRPITDSSRVSLAFNKIRSKRQQLKTTDPTREVEAPPRSPVKGKRKANKTHNNNNEKTKRLSKLPKSRSVPKANHFYSI